MTEGASSDQELICDKDVLSERLEKAGNSEQQLKRPKSDFFELIATSRKNYTASL